MTLHVVHTDALLWALGGYVDDADPRNWPNLYSADKIRALRRIAKTPRLAVGEATALAERLGMSLNLLSNALSRIRHGHEPRYWKDVA